MPKTEQESASIFLSEKNPFDLTFRDGQNTHRLSIEEPLTFGQGTTKESQDLMRAMMTAHLVAPKMPEKISTNFDFHFPELLYEMYEYYGKRKPKILRIKEQVTPILKEQEVGAPGFDQATTHSGGLDSVYRIAKLLEEGEIPLAVHLKNLNAKGNYRESMASEEQCQAWEVPYVSVRLRNGSGSSGFDTMKTRDLLLALTVAVQAAPNNVKKVLLEGGMGTTNNFQFSENLNVWKWFNKLLKETGLDMEVVGVDPGDIETIGEVLGLEKKLGISILPMVQNCFSASFQLPNNRRKWERETPNISEGSSDHWCGSCLKCRRMTLGRLFYGDPRFKDVSRDEVNYFVRDTYDWLKKYPNNADLISESFLVHLAALEN
jgi:hypothetical protein